jgi:hypothetical protein
MSDFAASGGMTGQESKTIYSKGFFKTFILSFEYKMS